ncbi:MAG: hypothetical protein ACYDBB_10730 [Armatimonadota bacterium]
MRRSIADILQGLLACLAGAITFIFFHEMWYRHWMNLLGDPPMINPAYDSMRAIFVSLPYAISALVIGLIAGFGYVRPWWRNGIRFIVGPVFAMLLLIFRLENAAYTRWYVPVLLASFAVSLVITAIYQGLTNANVPGYLPPSRVED